MAAPESNTAPSTPPNNTKPMITYPTIGGSASRIPRLTQKESPILAGNGRSSGVGELLSASGCIGSAGTMDDATAGIVAGLASGVFSGVVAALVRGSFQMKALRAEIVARGNERTELRGQELEDQARAAVTELRSAAAVMVQALRDADDDVTDVEVDEAKERVATASADANIPPSLRQAATALRDASERGDIDGLRTAQSQLDST
jgi:hypothetical protein